MFWNAHSITNFSKKLELEQTLKNEKIDIILIVETFLKPKHTFTLNNFIVYRNGRSHQAHSGVAIAIEKSIRHKLCAPINTTFIENIAIEIMINSIPTRITSAYSPKSSPHFKNDIQLLTNINTQYLIFGDFNAKHSSWNCKTHNTSGNTLFTLQQSSNFLIYHTDTPTHFPDSGRNPSTIDLLLSNVTFAFNLYVSQNLMQSDHVPIVCNYGSVESYTTKLFDYSRAKWMKYRHVMESNVSRIASFDTPNEINTALSQLTQLILYAKTRCIPTKQSPQHRTISAHTKQIIQIKNTMKRRWQRMSYSIDKRRAKRELNKIQKTINKMVKDDHNNFMAKKAGERAQKNSGILQNNPEAKLTVM